MFAPYVLFYIWKPTVLGYDHDLIVHDDGLDDVAGGHSGGGDDDDERERGSDRLCRSIL